MNFQKLLPVLLVVTLASCGQGEHNSVGYASESVNNATTDTMSVTVDDAADINSPARKIIKTADVRCRVNDVYKATEHMETLVRNVGGQISESRIENQQTETKRQSYSSDSMREVTVYTTSSHLVLKVPVSALDSVLRDIPSIASFMDTRHLKLDDVTYQYMNNQLKNEAAKDVAALALKRAKKSSDVVGVSEYNDQRNETQIDRNIDNLQMLDQIRYATLTVDLYQPSKIDMQIVADTDKLSQPGFGHRLGQSLLSGWELVEAAFLVLLRIWPIILIAAVIVIVLKRRKTTIFGDRNKQVVTGTRQ